MPVLLFYFVLFVSYDTLDQMTNWSPNASGQTQQEQYIYDASGNRVLRRSTSGPSNSPTTTITTYAFGLEEHAYTGTGTSTGNLYYYFLGSKLIGSFDGTNTIFYLTDALGSIVSAFSNLANSAALLGNQLFGPYGVSGTARYLAGSINTAKGFTGQYNDALTGLDYFNARYYDPAVGVFLSADTAQGNAQGMNPYGYVGGNPETYTDPTGHYMLGFDGSHAYATPDGNGGVTLTTWTPSTPGSWWETIYHYNARGVLDTVPRTPGNSNSSLSQGILQQILGGIGAFFSNLWNNLTGPTPSGGSNNPLGLPCGSLSLSFAPTTKVATSQGEKTIGSLHPGERVWAYNTKTHKMELQPIIHVWINHDNDLVDVTIVSTIPALHGKAAQRTSEVIHTNKKHPFLTIEKGFIPVSQLRIGMHIASAGGSTGTITTLKIIPGVMTMYNLEVAQDHTYAVGDGKWIVHNCDIPVGSNDDPTANITMQDILNNPQLLRNLSPQQVEQIAARDGGWVMGPLRKSSLPGEAFNQLNSRGTAFTDKYIQWHAGGGQHGADPYWKVSTNQGIVRVPYEGVSTAGGDTTGEDTTGEDIPPDLIDP